MNEKLKQHHLDALISKSATAKTTCFFEEPTCLFVFREGLEGIKRGLRGGFFRGILKGHVHVEKSMFYEDLASIELKQMYCCDSFFAWEGEEGEEEEGRIAMMRGILDLNEELKHHHLNALISKSATAKTMCFFEEPTCLFVFREGLEGI